MCVYYRRFVDKPVVVFTESLAPCQLSVSQVLQTGEVALYLLRTEPGASRAKNFSVIIERALGIATVPLITAMLNIELV